MPVVHLVRHTTLTVGRSGISPLTFNDHAHFTGERREMLTHG